MLAHCKITIDKIHERVQYVVLNSTNLRFKNKISITDKTHKRSNNDIQRKLKGAITEMAIKIIISITDALTIQSRRGRGGSGKAI